MDMTKNRRRFVVPKWLLLALVTALLIFAVKSLHDFLAVTRPVGQGILVVEAWIPTPALSESTRIFGSHRYRYLVLVGGPVQGESSSFKHSASYPDLAEDRLGKLGFHSMNLVKVNVPAEPTGRRTLATAAEFRRWLDSSGIQVCCVDILTVGVHARKSWVLFRYALGDRCRVGIISGTASSETGSVPWFLSPRGIWIFVRNLAGYVYAKLLVLSNPRLTLGA